MSDPHCLPLRAACCRVRRAFTLIEVLIVVVILGLLAAIVLAQFHDASEDAGQAAIDMQLSRTRKQIEYYRAQVMADPLLVDNQWDDLVANHYLQQAPMNMLNGSTQVASAPGPDVGWVWRDPGTGVFDLFATDRTGLAYHTE